MANSNLAVVLSMGTALPRKSCLQKDFAHMLFKDADKNEKNELLKSKLNTICQRSGILQRFIHGEQRYKPELASSLSERLEISGKVVPELMAEAAEAAITEWGCPAEEITHLVAVSTTTVEAPGADVRLAKLLGLRKDVKRTMLCFQGCASGASALRLAKEMAENNPGSRVLVACCEMASLHTNLMHELEIVKPANLVSSAIFGDGASAAVVGSLPKPWEHPLFEIHHTMQVTIEGTERYIGAELHEFGLNILLSREVPTVISRSIASVLGNELLDYSGCSSFNDMFWAVHPGGKAILDGLIGALELDPHKLSAARSVLSSCGNMSSATVLFVLDNIRKSSYEHQCCSTGEGCEWGMLLAFGPGITVEALLLKSFPLFKEKNINYT